MSTEVQTTIDNKLREALFSVGIADIRPTRKKLEELGTSLHMFNKYVDNRAPLPIHVAQRICDWLKLPKNELL